jgi:hypothetical protein
VSDTPPNPCRSCGTALQHCLEMRNPCELDDVCATACCNECLLHYPGLHTLSASNQRTTRELRPGDTVRAAGPTVRTVLVNDPPRPGSRWHVLGFRDGTSFWSAQDDCWELAPVLREYAIRNSQGEIFPMPSRAYAQHVAEGAPDLQAVSRPVPPWEVLR